MTYVQPVLPAVIVLLFAAVVLFSRRPRLARYTFAGVTSILFLWSWTPVAEWHLQVLQSGPSDDRLRDTGAEAIVVLSAGLRAPDNTRPHTLLDSHGYERTRYAAWLQRSRPTLPVLASGGEIGPPDRKVVVAEVMREVLISSGVPPEMIWTEGQSLSTYENALFSARILRERGIGTVYLVTDGFHMWRAEACFRKQGVNVIPAPCTQAGQPYRKKWTDYVPSLAAMSANEDALHEWIGLLWYRLSGKL